MPMFHTIKSKLLLAVILPLCFMAYTGISSFVADRTVASEMVKIQSLTDFAVHTSGLIHETQKERGYTAGYLKSGGNVFAKELPTQRISTDQKIASLREFLADFDLESQDVRVRDGFQSALAMLSEIQAKRSAITAQTMPASDAIAYYTDMHARFLASIAAIAHQSEDAKLAQSLNSFAIFLEGKERGGIERALMSGALASNSLQDSTLRKLSEVVAKQHEYFKAYHRTSTDEEYDIFQREMAKPAASTAETIVTDTFALALDNSKTQGFESLAASLSYSSPLAAASSAFLLNHEGADALLSQAQTRASEALEAYGALGRFSEADSQAIESLRGQISGLDAQLKATRDGDSSKMTEWAEVTASNLATLAQSKTNLGSDLTAPEWFKASTARLGLLKQIETGLAEALIAQASETRSQANASMLWHGLLALFAIAAVSMSGMQVFRSITGRVRFLVQSIDRVDKQHDLTLRIEDQCNDELSSVADSFDKLVASLQHILVRVDDVSMTLGEGAAQVGSSSQSLAVGATQQAANLQSVNAQVGSILEQTKRNTDSAESASTLAETSKKSAIEGMEHMQNMSSAMDEIAVSSQRIGDIIKTIDELAFQTNLLALNANVEAARAGEAGKGFGVVAEEVRSLAQKSAQAAKDTASVISESTQCAERGVTITAQVRTKLNEITESTNQVNDILAGIASASQEQTTAIAGVNVSLSELDDVTQYNAAHSEELAAAADQTAGECSTLGTLVSQFELGSESQNESKVPTDAAAPSVATAAHPAVAPQTPPTTQLEAAPTIAASTDSDEVQNFDDADFTKELETF